MVNFNLEDDIALNELEDKNQSASENLQIWKEIWSEQLSIEKVAQISINNYLFAINTFIEFTKKYADNISLRNIKAKFTNRYLVMYQYELAEKKYKTNKLSKEEYLQCEKESNSKNLGKNDANFTVLKTFENTLSQRLTVLKMFLKFISLNNSEEFSYQPYFSKFSTIKISDKFTQYLTPKEMDDVVKFMSSWTINYKSFKKNMNERYAYREAILIILYILSGARSNEIVNVRLRDIRESSVYKKRYYILRIEEAKGGKKREVAVLRKPLKELIEYFKKELPSEEYYLSSTYKKVYTNKPTSPDNIRKSFNNILSIMGIKKSGLHICRRGYATKRIGVDKASITDVSNSLGNTIAVLEKHYIKHNAELFLKE